MHMLLLGFFAFTCRQAEGFLLSNARASKGEPEQEAAAAELRLEGDVPVPQFPLNFAEFKAPTGLNRQEMKNFEDMQYYTHINVGGQTITGIIDSGSFELVVFEKHCLGCGAAAIYNKTISNWSTGGALDQRLYYGSGDIYVRQAFDMVSIGSFPPINQTFWEGSEAHMPVLEFAKFQSIIGVGPPETPANDYWSKTAQAIKRIQASLDAGTIPPPKETRKVMDNLKASMELTQHRTLLGQYQLDKFSVCLGKRPGSAGFFTWNDTSPDSAPELFTRLRVVGRHTWTVNMTGVNLVRDTHNTFLGCHNGCGAVVDTGTSLLMMPTAVVDLLEDMITGLDADCHRLDLLPHLSFILDGHKFTLPPDAYLAEVDNGSPGSFAAGIARIRNIGKSQHCQLNVMESLSDTKWGPLWILGMPFFRQYYTSFSIGRQHSERSLYVAKASPGCLPTSPMMTLSTDRNQEFFLRRYNISRMYLPSLARQAMISEYVDL